MSARRTTRANPNVVTAIDDPERPIWRTETTCLSTFQTARTGPRDLALKETCAAQAWKAVQNEKTDDDRDRTEDTQNFSEHS